MSGRDGAPTVTFAAAEAQETRVPHTPYDDARYPGRFYAQAAPGRMAVLASLYGLTPVAPAHARVLEIGCGEGGQLLPLAIAHPHAYLLGIDLSAVSVGRARERAAALGLRNVEFMAADLRRFVPAGAPFDYVIAHGVLSWVDPETATALFDLVRRALAPPGIAYISFAAFPGGHLRQILRDLVGLHTRGIGDDAMRIEEAKRIVDFVLGAMPESSGERALLIAQFEHYRRIEPLLRFDLLSEDNEPSYFLDFVAAADAVGLQFLCESDPRLDRTLGLPPSARQWLAQVPDRLLREQYLDFIALRAFRQVLLCHRDLAPREDAALARIDALHFAAALEPLAPATTVRSDGPVTFLTANGHRVTCHEPIPTAVYRLLGAAYPNTLDYATLRAAVARELDLPVLPEDDDERLRRMLLDSFGHNVVTLQPAAITVPALGARPRADALVRSQAARGEPLVTVQQQSVSLDSAALFQLLAHCDGTRDGTLLAAAVAPMLPPGQDAHGFVGQALAKCHRLGLVIA